jgi:hypothetical protein
VPSHYSTIGLPVADEAELVRLAEAVGPLADPIGFDGGVYYPWRDASGAELWLQVNSANEFVGVQPHFAGTGRVVMRLAHRVRPPDAGPFDGGFYGWADPHGDSEGETAGDTPAGVPMVVDSPEFARLTPLDLPATVPMQIAAFAHEVEVFDTEADFDAAQDSAGPHMAAESFVPSGLFRPDGGPETLPEARAILTGRVLSSERRTNAHSNAPFVTVLVQCLGGTYDVVIDPALLDYPPTVGGILSGSFWLSGKVAAE